MIGAGPSLVVMIKIDLLAHSLPATFLAALPFLAVVLMAMAMLAAPVHAQTNVPDVLEGDWGTQAQCQAQRDVGPDETVEHVTDAPYRFRGQWVSRWFHYCRVMQVFPITGGPAEGGHMVRVMCGEDAVDRPWEIEMAREDDQLSMTWFSLDPDRPDSPPWEVQPIQRCDAESS